MARLIVGLTGAFGSGTTFLADNFFAKMGFTKYSLSEVLKEKYVVKSGDVAVVTAGVVSKNTRHEPASSTNIMRVVVVE